MYVYLEIFRIDFATNRQQLLQRRYAGKFFIDIKQSVHKLDSFRAMYFDML